MKKSKKDAELAETLKTWVVRKDSDGSIERFKRFSFVNTDDMIDFGQNIFTYHHGHNVVIETVYEIHGNSFCVEVKMMSVTETDDVWLLEKIEEEYGKFNGR